MANSKSVKCRRHNRYSNLIVSKVSIYEKCRHIENIIGVRCAYCEEEHVYSGLAAYRFDDVTIILHLRT